MKVDIACEKVLKDEVKYQEELKVPKKVKVFGAVSCLFLITDVTPLIEAVKRGELKG